MSAIDDRSWDEITAALTGEGQSAAENANPSGRVAATAAQHTATGESTQAVSAGTTAQPSEQNKSKNKQKGKQNKQVTFATDPPAVQQSATQAAATQPVNVQPTVEQTEQVQTEAQAQSGENSVNANEQTVAQTPKQEQATPQAPAVDTKQQATTMNGHFPAPVVPSQMPPPTLCGWSVVPRLVHGKPKMYFERRHHNPPENFKADRRGGRMMLPGLFGYGQQPFWPAPGSLPQYNPPQQQTPTITATPAPDPPKVAPETNKKEEKKQGEEKKEERSAPPPSPVTINIYTSNPASVKGEPAGTSSGQSKASTDKVDEASALNVKKVEKHTVTTDEEEEEKTPETPAVPKVKKVVKKTAVAVEEDEEVSDEAEVVTKTPKQNPASSKKVKHTKKIIVEEDTSEDEVVATPVNIKATKRKQSTPPATDKAASVKTWSSDTSVQAARPSNPRMVGTTTYVNGKATTKLNADAKNTQNEKSALKDNADNSSINSSQRGAKPAAPQNNASVPPQGGWPGPSPWYPPPMYGGFNPQMWPGMFQQPAALPLPAQKPTAKPSSKKSSTASSSLSDSRHDSDRPLNDKPASRHDDSKHNSAVPSRVGSDTPSDISVRVPGDWRGTIVIRDPKPAKPTSKSSVKAGPEELKTAPDAAIDVSIHHHSVSKPHPPSNLQPPTSHRPSSASPEVPFTSSHQATQDAPPKHPQRVWQHPKHKDVWEIFSISTKDEFDPGRDREIHPNDSASQIASVVHGDEKVKVSKEKVITKSRQEWIGEDDKGREWEVDVNRRRTIDVPTGEVKTATARGSERTKRRRNEEEEEILLRRTGDLSTQATQFRRSRAGRDETSPSPPGRHSQRSNAGSNRTADLREFSRTVRSPPPLARQSRRSQVIRNARNSFPRHSQRSDAGSGRTAGQSRSSQSNSKRPKRYIYDEMEAYAPSVRSKVSSRRDDTASPPSHSKNGSSVVSRSRGGPSSNQDDDNGAGNERRDDQSEKRRYREHQSNLSQRSRRSSYRRPEHLKVHEGEKVVEVWGAAEVKRDDVKW